VLVTRLRWWADHIEASKSQQKVMAEVFGPHLTAGTTAATESEAR
jgi:hypothetical protein